MLATEAFGSASFQKAQPTHRVWDREACASRGGDVPERAGPKTSSCGAGHARDTKSNVLDAHPAVVQAGATELAGRANRK